MIEKINIVFLPISIIDGMAGTKRLQNFALNLASYDNIEISNICIQNRKRKPDKYFFLNYKNYFSVTFNYKNPLTWISYFFTVNYGLLIYRKSSYKNILYNYEYPNLLNIFYLIFAKLIGYKVVFDIVEDNSTMRIYKNFISKIKVSTSNFLIKKISLIGDGVIVISKHLLFKLKAIVNDEIQVIHLPITVNFNKIDIDYGKIKNNSEINIFYGGSFGDKDGISFLLNAFDILADEFPQIKLILTGSASKRYLINFNTNLNRINNINRVVYKGYLNDEKYYYELCSSDILCMTRVDTEYSNAGFPFKLGEMLATGKPVIATKVGDVTHYLSNNDAILIEPNSVKSIIEAVRKLIYDEKLRLKIGENGRHRALEYFDSKTITKHLLDFLNQV